MDVAEFHRAYAALNPQASTGLTVRAYDTLPSTNRTLWQLLDWGEAPPVAVVARRQTAGRGQWGRRWHSPPGGLYLSIALAPQIPADCSLQLTLCSAWGIARALHDCNVPVQLKWPNDLAIRDRKLGGIKTETRVRGHQIVQAVVGVGINWINPVPPTGINLQSVLQAQAAPAIRNREQLAATVANGVLSGWATYWGQGMASLLQGYHRFLSHQGRSVAIGETPGTIVGVTLDGRLRVRLANPDAPSEVWYRPGEISLGYARSEPFAG